MSEWKTERLKNIVEINPTVRLAKSKKYPFIRMEDVDENKHYVYEKNLQEYAGQSSSKFESGDILFARITPSLENRKISRVFLKTKNKGFGSTEFLVFRGITNITSTCYLNYLLQSDIVVLPAINSMYGASGRQRADRKFIENLAVKIPPIKDQRKIASVLSSYDGLIENNNRRIELLENMAEEIYKEWFVRMRFPGYENVKFEKGIPSGWSIKPFINESVKLVTSGVEKYDGYKTYLATADVNGINIVGGEEIGYKDKPSRANMQPVENSVWFAKMKDSIKHLYFDEDDLQDIDELILSTGFSGLKFKNNDYFYYYLSFIRYGNFEELKNMYANGSTQVAINNQNIKRLRVMLPSRDLILKYNDVVKNNYYLIKLYKEQNKHLIEQRDMLLPRLMNGTIDVK